jgi:acetyltransferase-like isoleucine patch superfamily enzyme
MKTLFKAIIVLLPWIFKRKILQCFFGYKLHNSSYVGFAWIYPDMLNMENGSRIDHFNVAIHLDDIHLGSNATIGRKNWITGFSSKTKSKHFAHQKLRKSSLVLKEGASITKNHHFDCTSPIEIGSFTTIAGYQSQFLTHSIDIYKNRQDSQSIKIGSYSFVGSRVIVLGGAKLPDYSVLGANSLLNKQYSESYSLYAGSPAKLIQKIPNDAKYFQREDPYVW